MGCHFLLQEIFPTQGLNPGLPHCRQMLYCWSHQKWELTQRKPLGKKTRYHPTTSSTLCRTPHLNNKQNKNKNPIISRQDYQLTQPCQSEEKQTNKNSAQISPYSKLTHTHTHTKNKAYTNHWTNPRRTETKKKKEFNLEAWEKETSSTVS